MRWMFLSLILFWSGGALAAERVALLIGNAEYRHTSRLKSPGRDVGAMRDALIGLGFEVEIIGDAGRRKMGKAIRAFSRRARKADTAFFYFSGHGMEIAGRNYLVPVDAQLDEEDDAELEAIGLGAAIAAASGAKRLSLVVLDACRDNRFASAAKSGAKGFRPIRARRGQLIAFATAPGSLAYDGGGALSPFTQALTEVLKDREAQGLDVRRLFGGLGPRVSALARGEQEPFTHSSGFGLKLVTLTGAAPAPARSGVAPLSKPLSKPAPAAPRSFAARLRALPQGRGLKECGACPEMVAIPGGRFMMGSPKNEPGRSKDEGPQRRVTIQPFAMGKYEVTFAEWDSCAADGFCRSIPKGGVWKNGDQGWGRGLQPAITISWNDIKGEAGDGKKGFLAWLNSKVEGAPYRLPTEAEWEYAARAGKSTPFWWGRSITPYQANYNGTYVYKGGGSKGAYRQKTVPVQSFQPNPFGLYQVHGNVWEWVEDCWSADYSGAPSNGSANKNGDCSRAVHRGGSWVDHPVLLRSANRNRIRRGFRSYDIGFRVARTLRE